MKKDYRRFPVDRLLRDLLQHGALSPHILDARLRDPTSGQIVAAVLSNGPLSVTQIARWISSVRGRCARETVRSRLSFLMAERLIVLTKLGTYDVSASLRRTWRLFIQERRAVADDLIRGILRYPPGGSR